MENLTENITACEKHSTGSTCLHVDLADIIMAFSFVIGTVIFGPISFVANILIIYTILSGQLCSKLAYVLIVNLCICDAFLALVSSLFTIGMIILQERIIEIPVIQLFIIILDYAVSVICVASLMTVLMMAFELFFMVKYPLKYLILNELHFKIVLISIWTIAVAPVFVDIAITLFDGERTFGRFLVLDDYHAPTYLIVVLAVLVFVAIVGFYTSVIREIYKSNAAKLRETRRIRKSAVTICLVVFTFFLLYLPLWIAIIVEVVFNKLQIEVPKYFTSLRLLLYLFLVINTFCDALIYAFRIRVIRQACAEKFCTACIRHGRT